MTQPYKMYRFRCSNASCRHEWTASEHTTRCPRCGKVNQNIGKYTPYS